MKKRILIVLAAVITCPVWASDIDNGIADFTGESFFTTSTPVEKSNNSSSDSDGFTQKHTTPPIKSLRLYVKSKIKDHQCKNSELAPTQADIKVDGAETSEYASKEEKTEFDDSMLQDDIEEATETVEQEKQNKKGLFASKAKKETTETQKDNIILDCDKIDYDTDHYVINANGNAVVTFVEQGTILKADTIVYDRVQNSIRADGHVKIKKGTETIYGDYIFVDMNEENALIDKPVVLKPNIEMHAKKGYVYGDKIVQESGSIVTDGSFPIDITGDSMSPRSRGMLFPKNETITHDMNEHKIRLQTKYIKLTQKGDLETLAVKRMSLLKNEKVIFKFPAVKFYTNKNHEYIESNVWELGSYRGLGFYTGPGFVFELPKGSVFKAMPIFNINKGVGVGGYGRFSSGTNQTFIGYGTAQNKLIIYGRQKLDDNLSLQYGMNSYFDDWFLGRRRPKYGANLTYKNSYSSSHFLLPGRTSSFEHRISAGYFQNLDFDNNYERINGTNMGTTRFRYMARAHQNFWEYKNPEKLTAFTLGVTSQLSAALYGSGDTQFVGMLGPHLHTQYKRWMQDISYHFTVADDHTPLAAYDAYRYGSQNLMVREYFRLCRYLTVAWFSTISLTNDTRDGRRFPEQSFYVSVGPDDLKLNIGYDFIRNNLFAGIELMLDAKGSRVDYEKFELKQDKKVAEKKSQTDSMQEESKPTNNVLNKAVVEDMKIMDDVL